jgi:hypothetical protein
MTTAWTVPVATDLEQFMSSSVVTATNVDDPAGKARADSLIESVVARVRGAIGSGNRVPLSLTPNSVPPEGKQHVLVLIVAALAAASPQVYQYTESDAFRRQLEAAEKWITAAQEGLNVTVPTDPDPDNTPSTAEWGDIEGDSTVTRMQDMTTD